MADQTPDEREDERPATSPRRSGLERLRAARGAAGAPAAADRDAASSSGPTSATAETSGRTAVLEGDAGRTQAGEATGPRPDAERSTDTSTSTVTTSSKAARRRRQKDRKAAGTAAGAGIGTAARLRGSGAHLDPAGPPTTRQAAVAAVLALLLVGLLVPAVLKRDGLVGKTKEEKAVESLVAKRDDALAFARRFTVTFFSPDYKTVDAYNDQVAAMTTGDFNKDFVAKRGDLKSLLTKVQSQATSTVLAAGVSKVSGPDVEVLAVADQQVKTNVRQGPVTNRYRVRVSLHQTDKGWAVTNFEPVT